MDLNASNSELCIENSRLRRNMEEMKKIVGPADFEKEIDRLKYQLECKESCIESLTRSNQNLITELNVVKNLHCREAKLTNHWFDQCKKLEKKLADIGEIVEEEK